MGTDNTLNREGARLFKARPLSVFAAKNDAARKNKKERRLPLPSFASLAPARQSASASVASSRKLTGRNPSLHEIIADFLFFIQPL